MSGGRDPYLDEGMRGYIHRTAAREFWKVAGWYELEDLVQDGYMCYYKCRHRPQYVAQLSSEDNPSSEDRRWMMSLVKVTFDRHITTLASKRMGVRDAVYDRIEVSVSGLSRPDDEETADPWDTLAPGQFGNASLVDLILSLPSEMQQLLVILAGDGGKALGFNRSTRLRRTTANGSPRMTRRRRRTRETTNEYYCRLVGLDPREHDLASQVEALRAEISA